MAGRLHGKTAIVTSAGQGIGRASAICMAKEGAKVWATDINAEALASLAAAQAGIETFTLDVLNQDQVDAAAKRVDDALAELAKEGIAFKETKKELA